MNNTEIIRQKLIEQINHHLDGLKDKIIADFSKESFEREIADLDSDPVYNTFYLNCAEYAFIRKFGRISISIGRRLGEIYDKIPRYIAQIVFEIPENKIAPKMRGKIELDTCLPFEYLSATDKDKVISKTKEFCGNIEIKNGVGIEIRYNFNPNDSSRLRKDVDMATYLIEEGLCPIYLIYSSISPRDEAIARLKRAGWNFLVGDSALHYTSQLYGVDMTSILREEEIASNIKNKINKIMKELFTSYGYIILKEKY